MINYVIIVLGGGIGAAARFALGTWIGQNWGRNFPLGTFVINISGSFILGVIMGTVEAQVLSPAVRLGLAIGFVGAYTTFSTWTYETMRLIEGGSWLLAAVNIFGSIAVGMLAVALGLAAGRGL